MTAAPATKVAILGGGIAALTAAFELTELHDEDAPLDITIYTLGWRLGGKGAVGRNAAMGLRAEEHGLHVWPGFYHNAFHLMGRCYRALEHEVKETPPFGSLWSAFERLDHTTIMEEVDDEWMPWRFDFPRRGGRPGRPGRFVTLTSFVQTLVKDAISRIQRSGQWRFVDMWPDKPPEWVTNQDLRRGFLSSLRAYADALPADPKEITEQQRERLEYFLGNGAQQLRAQQRAFTTNDRPRRAFIQSELALTLAYGMFKDGVIWNGFDHIDDKEWTAWMASHGCSSFSLDSALVRAFYDFIFGYVGDNRSVGAGTGTRLLLRLSLGYGGSFFYTMKATMGELVFAPLYKVLRARGVKFEFFKRVENLNLSSNRRSIDSIKIGIQATPRNAPYDPLIAISDGHGNTLSSWPSQPKFDLLAEGDRIRDGGYDLESAWTDWPNVNTETLSNFNVVVLGIGFGSLRYICNDLVGHLDGWSKMIGAVKTTPTMALQLWMTETVQDLGWPYDRTILTAFQDPLDTWGDVTPFLALETWPEPPPRSLGFFCGSFRDDPPAPPPSPVAQFPRAEAAYARQLALDWVKQHLASLWPNVEYSGAIQWQKFYDPYGATGEARFAAQYVRANINPSDRYVLSVPGSVFARMAADGSGVGNLFLAGDWVRTGLNAGCMEAAVMAGRAAAGAIKGVHIAMPNSSDFDDFALPAVILPTVEVLRQLGRAAAAGVGNTSAYCVIVPMERDFVRSKLPPGLKLRHPSAATQKHDVVLIFARQTNVRPGFVPLGGINYNEVSMLIPYVTYGPNSGSDLEFSYMPHLLLDDLAAVLVGQNLYGFNKQLARIRAVDGAFDVRSPIGGVQAQFERTGLPGDISRFKDIVRMRDAMELPLVGVAANGSFIHSIDDLHLAAATFQGAKGKVTIGPPFAKEVTEIEVQAVTQQVASRAAPPSASALGFHMATRFSFSLPFRGFAHEETTAAFGQRLLVAEHLRGLMGGWPLRRR